MRGIKMNVKELIKIIRDEKLYYYTCYRIGHPDEPALAMSYAGNSPIDNGICCGENGMWKEYCIEERGRVIWANGELTEDEACQKLLHTMREEKAWRIKRKKRKERKRGVTVIILPDLE
jgi:hypothetical protein